MSLAISTLAHRIALKTPLSYDAAMDLIEGLLRDGIPWEVIERSPFDRLPMLRSLSRIMPLRP